jgi:hypothetical protein
VTANTITYVLPKLLAQGLLALRQQAIMPRLVNRGYETIAGQKGSTISVPIPSAITAVEVTPAQVPIDTAAVSPTEVQVSLNQWWEAPFFLTDKDMMDCMEGTIPMQASEAIKTIANKIDDLIFATYKGVYGWGGTAGTTPFASDLAAFVAARKALNNQLAPMDPRNCVIDADAEANALLLRAFQDASFRGDTEGIINGQIGRKLGALWVVDQNVPYHTCGTVSTSWIIKAGTAHAVGLKTLTTTTGGTAAMLEGDVITIAGDTQTYVLTAAASRSGAGDMTVYVEPGLKIALVGSEAITIKASHRVNLLFHRDAFAFASRPLAGADMGLGNFQSAVDPVSGLVLRLEISREYKRTRFSYDILCGTKLVRRELAARIAG